MTGVSDPVPQFTESEDKMNAILGKSAAFVGCKGAETDTPIEVNRKKNITKSTMKLCRAESIGKPSEIVQAINSG